MTTNRKSLYNQQYGVFARDRGNQSSVLQRGQLWVAIAQYVEHDHLDRTH